MRSKEGGRITESTEVLGISMAPRLTKNIKKPAALQFSETAHLEQENDIDDMAWTTRSAMWQSRVQKASARSTKRAKAQPALILAGHGVSLRVENGALTIQNGFTHYPQPREIIRYFSRRRYAAGAHYFTGRQRQHFIRRFIVARRAKSQPYSH
jgi:hypothetical protein